MLNSSATKLSSLSVNYEFRKLTQDLIRKYLIKKGLKYLSVNSDDAAKAADKAGADFLGYFVVAAPPSGCGMEGLEKIADPKKPTAGQIDTFVSTFDECFTKAAVAAAAAAKADGKDLDTVSSAYNQKLQADIASFQKSLKGQISGWDRLLNMSSTSPSTSPRRTTSD